MPTPASPSASASSSHRRASSDLMVRIGSADSEIKLRALRELKSQIIGNHTKKLVFLKLGAMLAVFCALAQAQVDLLVQSVAALRSFACDFDAGIRAVLDSGAFANLIALQIEDPQDPSHDQTPAIRDELTPFFPPKTTAVADSHYHV